MLRLRNVFCCFFFFNGTATTEIYTYCHTLSLHDALPILTRHQLRRLLEVSAVGGEAQALHQEIERLHPGRLDALDLEVAEVDRPVHRNDQVVDRNAGRCRAVGQRLLLGRSEEHTSELQSLMRISYAVFCLKKKNIKQIDQICRNLSARTKRNRI